ncbi:M23 family metallopeptidase [Mesorhizobium caraganae]|uniref:M23 family metallopeptidase n=1 Tax=Mesorhizobium caraganae TaxID=483206 RepID=UPI00193A04B2|nr:M23 family metallopeptidase [Mesorhizobium caraganae]MBM2711053.1 M23 family metallopeptidase [Mesorhizobium caraganae]
MDSEGREALDRIARGIRSLRPLGANAVHRRTFAIVKEEIQRADGVKIERDCGDDDPGPRQPIVSDGRREYTFNNAYFEFRQDDRRRSIFLDPVESLAAQFVDFYTDRVDTLEFRHDAVPLEETVLAAEQKAIEYLRDKTHLVNVMTVAAEDTGAIIDTLRSLAYVLEQREKNQVNLQVASFSKIATLGREICKLVRTEAGASQWSNNGRTLSQPFRDVYSCIDSDACCTNQAYTKYGEWTTRTVWQDDGNVANPPPVVPPPFTPHNWDNHCAVLSTATGTVSSDWGWRGLNGQSDFHGGMDIAVPVGTQVFAAVAGEVVYIRRNGANGETGVVIRTGNDTRTYWHIDPGEALRNGAVNAGALLGTVAARSEVHLHFALHSPPGGDFNLRSDANSHDPCP